MKFPRNVRLLRSPFDVAPFAAVFFLLVIFLMLAVLLPTPGIPLELPVTESSPGKDLPGTDQPTVAVALDSSGRFYFANQIVSEPQLELDLHATAKNSREPLALVIHADKAVTYDQLVRLTLLARDAGITNVLLATLPRVINMPAQP
jgi:biopolymer transport protein ExbD